MNNVINSKITIYRNLKEFKFAHKLTNEQKQEIIKILEEQLKDKMDFINISTANEKVVEYLLSRGLSNSQTQNLFMSRKKDVSINLFNGEHLAIVSTSESFDKNIISRAVEIVDMLSTKLTFAYSDEYGYLMCDLNKIGTGIKLETNIMLSAITKINKIDQLKQNLSKLGYSLKETKYPAIYTLSTRCNLGVAEKQLVVDFEKTLSKLQDLEIESVKMLDVTNHDEMIDKVSRSVAILNSAHLISYDELYNIIVNLRMGINLGLINIKLETINKLQSLIMNKLNDIVSQSEMKMLCEKTKEILKGE